MVLWGVKKYTGMLDAEKNAKKYEALAQRCEAESIRQIIIKESIKAIKEQLPNWDMNAAQAIVNYLKGEVKNG